ncbi:hypothetical protein GOV03_01200 [Candidatus Woesearchaeota archaeon]|nr:hypothetical protein [Candidatus Woesearchaeota archaeon]
MGVGKKVCDTITVLGIAGVLSGLGGAVYYSASEPESTPEIGLAMKLEYKINRLENHLERNIMRDNKQFNNPKANELFGDALQIEYDSTKQEYDQLMTKPKLDEEVASYRQAKNTNDMRFSDYRWLALCSLFSAVMGRCSGHIFEIIEFGRKSEENQE